METLVSFALGIGSSIAAFYLINLFQYMVAKKDKIKIEGEWGEFVPMSLGRQYSFGRIYFDKGRKMYAFDGTNYSDNGERFCHWETVVSHVDANLKKFFYTFTAQLEGELDKIYYGFGVINLVKDASGSLVPMDGYYISANVDGKTMSHSMKRIDGVRYERGGDGQRIIPLLAQ